MAKSPVRQIIIRPDNEGPPIAETTIISPLIRMLRFLRGVLILVLIAGAFGAGVLTGTSGQFADVVAELRRWAQLEPGDNGTVAAVLDALAMLDASEGIDAVKTRHGVGDTLSSVETVCREELDSIRDATARVVARALTDIRSDIARAQVETSTRLDDLEATAEATGVLAANAEGDCKVAHERFGEMLDLLPDEGAETETTEE